MTLTHWPLLVDRDEAATVLRTTAAVVDRLTLDGRLPAIHLEPGDEPRYRPEDLMDLVDLAASRKERSR